MPAWELERHMMEAIRIKVSKPEPPAPRRLALPLCSPSPKGCWWAATDRCAVTCSRCMSGRTLSGEILGRGRSDPLHEVGGWLFGFYASDGTCPFVVVEGSMPAQGGSKSSVSFRFTCEDQERMASVKEEEYPDQLVLGWYHSHPIGLTLSDVDVEAHRTVFRQPFHIALVMGIGGREVGCAVWDGDQVSDVGGFWVLEKAPAQATSGMPEERLER